MSTAFFASSQQNTVYVSVNCFKKKVKFLLLKTLSTACLHSFSYAECALIAYVENKKKDFLNTTLHAKFCSCSGNTFLK